jgi:hypothetical protein
MKQKLSKKQIAQIPFDKKELQGLFPKKWVSKPSPNPPGRPICIPGGTETDLVSEPIYFVRGVSVQVIHRFAETPRPDVVESALNDSLSFAPGRVVLDLFEIFAEHEPIRFETVADLNFWDAETGFVVKPIDIVFDVLQAELTGQ